VLAALVVVAAAVLASVLRLAAGAMTLRGFLRGGVRGAR